jgi:hypothetical protein
MFNYYNFTTLINDEESFKYFNSLSNKNLNYILNNSFNYIDDTLNEYSNIFKGLFKCYDYNELYYSCKALSEELNNIKIIINILRERNE